MLHIIFLAAGFLIAAALLLVAAFFVYGPADVWRAAYGSPDLGRYDFADFPRTPSGNDALACSPGACPQTARVDVELATPTSGPQALVQRIDERIARFGGKQSRVDDGSDPLYRRYVAYTPILQFPDTVDIEVMERSDGLAAIRAYSRSMIGRGDFGQNEERLRDWLGPSQDDGDRAGSTTP